MNVRKLCHTQGFIRGITVDDNENVYFTYGNDNIYHIRKNKKEPKILINIEGAELCGIVYSNNILYICDYLKHKILSYSIDTGKISTFAGNGYGYKDGHINDAQFCFPRGITIDKNGDLYITNSHHIRKINLSSRIVETIAGLTTEYGYGGHKDGEAKNAMFNFPSGLIIDSDDTIYVADSWNHCIRRIKNGIVSTIAGILDKEGNEDGPINRAMFEYPYGLILDDEGNLLVGDDNGLRIVNMNEKIVSTLQGISKEEETYSLTKDSSGLIYVGSGKSILLLENTWKYKRLLWIGHLKDKDSPLSYLPREMIKEISNYL